jgi:LysW-gamma-L-lysine carboxypeptidase
MNLLEQCVRIPSLSGEEKQVAEFLCDEMQKRGFSAQIDEVGNAIGVMGCGARQIMLLGHMDTVGGEVPVRYEGTKLYGRGTVDAKGPLCAFILAVEQLFKQNKDWQDIWQIVVVGAVEEEAASSKGARHIAHTYKPEMCVIGEPSGSGAITLGYKGRVLIDAHLESIVHHTALPVPNAMEHAAALWTWIRTFSDFHNEGKFRAFDQLMPTLRKMESGNDGLHEWCDLFISLRLPLDFSPIEFKEKIEAWLDRMAVEQKARDTLRGLPASTLIYQVTLAGNESAYRGSKHTPLVRAFLGGIRSEGIRPTFLDKSGTSDMNVVGPEWNVPIIAYGPGDSALDHTPHEHIEIPEFERSVRVLTHALQHIVSGQ